MKQKLKSLRIHILQPVITMSVFVVAMLTTMFYRSYISRLPERLCTDRLPVFIRFRKDQVHLNILKERFRI